MQQVITQLVEVPFARMFVLAGLIFLLVGVVGKVEGKIEPGRIGRIGAAVLGFMLMMVGVAMQYAEVRETAIERLTQHVQTQIATPTPTSASTAERPTIKVVSGAYGRNCFPKAAEVTVQMAAACDGHVSCDFAIAPASVEDPAPNCNKEITAEWKCGNNSALYSATLPAGAGENEKLHLACAG